MIKGKVIIKGNIKHVDEMLEHLPDRYQCDVKNNNDINTVYITRKDGADFDNYDRVVINDRLMPNKVEIVENE